MDQAIENVKCRQLCYQLYNFLLIINAIELSIIAQKAICRSFLLSYKIH